LIFKRGYYLYIASRKANPHEKRDTCVEYRRSEIDMQHDETEWSRFDSLTDTDLDTDADEPKTDEAFWKNATVGMPQNVIDGEKRSVS